MDSYTAGEHYFWTISTHTVREHTYRKMLIQRLQGNILPGRCWIICLAGKYSFYRMLTLEPLGSCCFFWTLSTFFYCWGAFFLLDVDSHTSGEHSFRRTLTVILLRRSPRTHLHVVGMLRYMSDKPTELAHSFFIFCSRVCLCLYGPFNCISFHKFSRRFSFFSLCSAGLISLSYWSFQLYISLWKSPWCNP